MMLTELFEVTRGRGEYYSKLEPGNTPLVSATSENNGMIGRVDLEPLFSAPCITVERVAGQAFVQLEDFVTVPDDITVLIPKEDSGLTVEQLFYISALINSKKWKFSYGRKLTSTRLKKLLDIDLHIAPKDFSASLSRFGISKPSVPVPQPPHVFKEHLVTDFFDLVHGDFHSLDALDAGDTTTVSRVTFDNGIVGSYERPENAVVYPPLTLTVSTVSGDAFLQMEPFMATDNVVVLVPKQTYDLYFLLFMQSMINRTRWRYYYGRQCYKNRFAKTMVYIPLKTDGTMDFGYMERCVLSAPGWQELIKYARKAKLVLVSSTR